MKIGLVATVKASRSVLLYFVEHHKRIGIDHMVIYFDDPECGEGWDDHVEEGVEFIVCDSNYWAKLPDGRSPVLAERQKYNVNHASLILKSYGCEWLVHIDSDELILPKKHYDLHSELAKCSLDCLRFEIREALAPRTRKDVIFAGSWFKKNISNRRIRLLDLLGFGNVLQEGEYLRGHTASKFAVRLCDRIQSYGIHYPVPANGELKVRRSRVLWLLHFDAMNYSAWQAKLKFRKVEFHQAWNKTIRASRKKVFREALDAMQTSEDAIFAKYLELYTMNYWQIAILWVIGALSYIPEGKRFRNNPNSC